VASDQDSSPGILDGTSYSTSHRFDRQSKTMIHVSNSPATSAVQGRQGAQSITRLTLGRGAEFRYPL